MQSIQPRVCGDYRAQQLRRLLLPDTTPRVRGLLDAKARSWAVYRYNPACAGTTWRYCQRLSQMSIQPRVCGDYDFSTLKWNCRVDTTPRVRGLPQISTKIRPSRMIQPRVCGDYTPFPSPRPITGDTTPRVRGLPPAAWRMAPLFRYNPACAGTTLRAIFFAKLITIQPRVCGDYASVGHRLGHRADTTPRVRGLRIDPITIALDKRYNPACAGTTPVKVFRIFILQIQPRVCGDYKTHPRDLTPKADTTPRVRGLHDRAVLADSINRYNPACAGTTVLCHFSRPPNPIQPRVCGDYSIIIRHFDVVPDTTPRVRGLRRDIDLAVARDRYNPACAGTTQVNLRLAAVLSIQPRVCGDYLRTGEGPMFLDDTTPRVRGLPCAVLVDVAHARYNPACAGTTRQY